MFARTRCALVVAALVASSTIVMSTATAHAVTPPGKPRNLTVTVTAVDRGSGTATLAVEFDQASAGGGPTDHYQVDVCHVTGGALSCTTGFVPFVNIPFVPGHVVVPGPPTCPAGFSACIVRVRGVDSTGTLFSTPNSTAFAPWAPYSVSASSGPGVGQVTLGFNGPSEAGASGPGARHYVAFVCTSACGIDGNWSDSGLSIPYPPSGSPPFSSDPYTCGINVNCSFRLQFVDGAGAVSSLSEAVSAVGPVLTIDQPVPSAVTSDPTVAGSCTIDDGTVTATVNPGANLFTSPCSPSGTWSLSIASLADGVYTVGASQAGSPLPTAGPVSFTYDTTPPVTTDDTSSFAGWNTAPVSVTLTPIDAVSGVAATYYTTDGSTPTTSSASGTNINLTTDGVYTIKYFSVDVAGNTESVKTAGTPVMIDQHGPVVTFTPANGKSAGPTRWAAECATPGICGSVTDAPSGVASFGPATVRRLSDGKYWNGSAWQLGTVNAPVRRSFGPSLRAFWIRASR